MDTVPTTEEWLRMDFLYDLERQWKEGVPSTWQREMFFLPQVTKEFLKDLIKQLRNQCYEILNDNRDSDFACICNQPKLYEINRRIRDYQYRLRGVPKGGGTEITPDTIRRAKESPIQDNAGIGKLRSSGTDRLVGKCPLHPEKTGSFTIYRKSNTWHCYSCGAGRDVIDFVMKTQNLKFYEAIKYILKL